MTPNVKWASFWGLIALLTSLPSAFYREGVLHGYAEGKRVAVETCPPRSGDQRLISSSILQDRVICNYGKTYAATVSTTEFQRENFNKKGAQL